MKRKVSRFASGFLTGTLIASTILSAIPVFAAEVQESDSYEVNTDVLDSDAQSSKSEVAYSVEIGSTFNLTIPKRVSLTRNEKGEYDATYHITMLNSDIDPVSYVNVIGQSSFPVQRKDTEDSTTAYNDMNHDTSDVVDETLSFNGQITDPLSYTGYVNAGELAAGDWAGTMNFSITLENTPALSLSEDGAMTKTDVQIGENGTAQMNVYYKGQNVNDQAVWTSLDPNVATVSNGLVRTNASAKPGDTTTITVQMSDPQASQEVSLLQELGLIDAIYADNGLTASFSVTIVGIAITDDSDSEIETCNITAGTSKELEATIIPASKTGAVTWTCSAPAGITLETNGNTCVVNVADDMPSGSHYVIASYGSFSKMIKVNVSNYEESAGLYKSDGSFISWDTLVNDYGLDVTKDYDRSTRTGAGSGNKVFAQNNLGGVLVIDDSVTRIGNSSFYGCSTLTDIVFPNTLTSIGSAALEGSKGIKQITIPDSVTEIGTYAFTDMGALQSVTIGSGLTKISDNAFRSCYALASVFIPAQITVIGNHCFDSCVKLASFTVDPNNAKYASENGILYNKSKTTMLVYPFGTTSKTLTIPATVTNISSSTFNATGVLENIYVEEGNTVYRSENGLLYKGTVLVRCPIGRKGVLEIPDETTALSDYAVAYCSNLTGVTMPESVTKLGSYVFYTTKMTSAGGNDSDAAIKLSSNITTLPGNMFGNNTELKWVDVPESVTTISGGTFYNCKTLKYVYIPSSVSTVVAGKIDANNCPFFSYYANDISVYLETNEVPTTGWGAYWNSMTSSKVVNSNFGVSHEDFINLLVENGFVNSAES